MKFNLEHEAGPYFAVYSPGSLSSGFGGVANIASPVRATASFASMQSLNRNARGTTSNSRSTSMASTSARIPRPDRKFHQPKARCGYGPERPFLASARCSPHLMIKYVIAGIRHAAHVVWPYLQPLNQRQRQVTASVQPEGEGCWGIARFNIDSVHRSTTINGCACHCHSLRSCLAVALFAHCPCFGFALPSRTTALLSVFQKQY